MEELIVVALGGFCASMIDGALGMGFGPTSSSILLSTGLSPAAVSTTVNLAKVATGIAGGVAHWRFGNVDRRLVIKLAVPGCAGALVGVTVLANVDGDNLRPTLAALLLVVAVRMLIRFSRPLPMQPDRPPVAGDRPVFDERGTAVAAAAGGITNGLVGAWGPVVTPFLLHRGLAPRFAIGSVNTAEVAVAVVASGSLLASLQGDGVEADIVLAMLIGGVLAAPIAAWVIRFIPPRGLGIAVSGLLLCTNVRELSTWAEIGAERWGLYATIVLACAYAGIRGKRLAGAAAAAAADDPA
ncbi:MAG: sulfite exporter TauE/SafE family protein [Acidimicrobiales bacterium]|nr:sulfite exporter TauE/SafE family protein [Acidimicrobiales bacterium]